MRWQFALRTFAAFVLSGWLSTGQARSYDCGSYDVKDAPGVAEAVTGIRVVLECQGFTIRAVINHGGAAAGVGLDLRPTQLILFTDPRVDSLLIRWRRSAGIDLPQKLLIYEDADGKVRIHSNASSYIHDRHGILTYDFALARIGATFDQFDPDRGLVTVESRMNVDGTAGALRSAIQAAGFNSLVIDHAANPARDYFPLPPTQLVVFGNPRVATLLMQNEQTIGIDLPLKILVWQEARGDRVFMTYNDPRFIARRHNVDDLDTVLTGIRNTLQNLTGALAKPAA